MARALFQSRKPLFWEQIRLGLLAGDAGEAVGVSATCGRRWFREAGGVKPAVSTPKTSGSRPRLTLEDRIEIHAGIYANESLRSIGRRLGRPASTIKREIDANTELRSRKNPEKSGYRRKHAFGARQSGSSAKVDYRAMSAHDRSADRARRPKCRRLAKDDTLREQVQSRLELRHSPQQIAKRLRCDFPDDPEMWVSHEAIYQAIYVQGRGALRRELHQCLRTKRAVRRSQHQPGTRAGRIPDMINISQRPAEVADRAVPGHWEGDLIMGSTASNSAIGTLVERTTRFVMLLHLPDGHTAEAVQDAIIAKITELPEHLRLSLTGIKAARWPTTKPSPRPPISTSTSATHTRRGNAAATRTPTGYCASTSRRGQISPSGDRDSSTKSPSNSTADPAKHWAGEPRPKHSTNYSQTHQPLHRPLELKRAGTSMAQKSAHPSASRDCAADHRASRRRCRTTPSRHPPPASG
jgi:IS30 family transposase